MKYHSNCPTCSCLDPSISPNGRSRLTNLSGQVIKMDIPGLNSPVLHKTNAGESKLPGMGNKSKSPFVATPKVNRTS